MSVYNDVLYQHAFPEPTQLWSYYFESSERHKGFYPVSFMTQTYFTVKSADSGIQNSADGSREVLTNVPADDNLPEAGRNLSDAANSQIWTSIFNDKMNLAFVLQKLMSLHLWPCLPHCLLHPPVRRGSSMSPKSTARVCSSTGPHLHAACLTWQKRWPTELRSTGSTQRMTRGRRSWWLCKGWAQILAGM